MAPGWGDGGGGSFKDKGGDPKDFASRVNIPSGLTKEEGEALMKVLKDIYILLSSDKSNQRMARAFMKVLASNPLFVKLIEASGLTITEISHLRETAEMSEEHLERLVRTQMDAFKAQTPRKFWEKMTNQILSLMEESRALSDQLLTLTGEGNAEARELLKKRLDEVNKLLKRYGGPEMALLFEKGFDAYVQALRENGKDTNISIERAFDRALKAALKFARDNNQDLRIAEAIFKKYIGAEAKRAEAVEKGLRDTQSILKYLSSYNRRSEEEMGYLLGGIENFANDFLGGMLRELEDIRKVYGEQSDEFRAALKQTLKESERVFEKAGNALTSRAEGEATEEDTHDTYRHSGDPRGFLTGLRQFGRDLLAPFQRMVGVATDNKVLLEKGLGSQTYKRLSDLEARKQRAQNEATDSLEALLHQKWKREGEKAQEEQQREEKEEQVKEEGGKESGPEEAHGDLGGFWEAFASGGGGSGGSFGGGGEPGEGQAGGPSPVEEILKILQAGVPVTILGVSTKIMVPVDVVSIGEEALRSVHEVLAPAAPSLVPGGLTPQQGPGAVQNALFFVRNAVIVLSGASFPGGGPGSPPPPKGPGGPPGRPGLPGQTPLLQPTAPVPFKPNPRVNDLRDIAFGIGTGFAYLGSILEEMALPASPGAAVGLLPSGGPQGGDSNAGQIGSFVGKLLAAAGNVGGAGVKKFLEGLAEGLKFIGKSDEDIKKGLVVLASIAAILAGITAALNFVRNIDSSVLGGLLVVSLAIAGISLMVKILGEMDLGKLIIGVVAVAVIAAILVGAVFALSLVKDLDMSVVAAVGVLALAVAGLALVALIIGGPAMTPVFWVGLAALAATVGVLLVAVAGLAVIASMMPPGASDNLVGLATAVLAFANPMLLLLPVTALALLALATALWKFSTSVEKANQVGAGVAVTVGAIQQLSQVDGQALVLASEGIERIGGALSAFSNALGSANLQSAFSGLLGFFGSGPVEKLKQIADLKNAGLVEVAEALEKLASALETLADEKLMTAAGENIVAFGERAKVLNTSVPDLVKPTGALGPAVQFASNPAAFMAQVSPSGVPAPYGLGQAPMVTPRVNDAIIKSSGAVVPIDTADDVLAAKPGGAFDQLLRLLQQERGEPSVGVTSSGVEDQVDDLVLKKLDDLERALTEGVKQLVDELKAQRAVPAVAVSPPSFRSRTFERPLWEV